LIPPGSYVGLITFNRFVYVHEIGFEESPKCYAFSGVKEYTPEQVYNILQLPIGNKPGIDSSMISKRFIVPLGECEFILNSILDEI